MSNDQKNSDADANVACSVSSVKDKDGVSVLVTVRPPEAATRTPADVCCVIDVSGSMCTEATLQNANGATESHGLSLLDVVKHAVKTVIHTLKDCDRLALVAYSSDAKVVFPLQKMNDKGKKAAEAALEKLSPDGQTNLWDGLHTGLEELRKAATAGRISSLLLLTDGQPNVEPPRGHIPMLRAYKDQNSNMTTTINTFGFGYNLDSKLLNEIAIEGNGMYVFIPDSGFVGTVFVNTTSNVLVAMANNATLQVEPLNGAKIASVSGVPGYSNVLTSWGASVYLGTLQFGQHKDVVIRISAPSSSEGPFLRATLKYQNIASGKSLEDVTEGRFPKNQDDVEEGQEVKDVVTLQDIQTHEYRLLFTQRVAEAIALANAGKLNEAQALIESFIKDIRGSSAAATKPVGALLEDLEGQVRQAFSKKEWFTKWGVHYLPSLARAHLLQQCNNFKDPGVQQYGGKLFVQLRDAADSMFLKLPPPKPSIVQSGKATVAVKNMSTYHSRSNVCFGGEGLVLMADGSLKRVKSLAKGDLIGTPSGATRVLCVIKSFCDHGKAALVELGDGLLISPYHPVKVGGQWSFPCDLEHVIERQCPEVYNFVLETAHIMIINGIQCVTLGHCFKEPVVSHPFFGSEKIIASLSTFRGWSSGVVELPADCIVRDADTGMITGLRQ